MSMEYGVPTSLHDLPYCMANRGTQILYADTGYGVRSAVVAKRGCQLCVQKYRAGSKIAYKYTTRRNSH